MTYKSVLNFVDFNNRNISLESKMTKSLKLTEKDL